MPKLSVNRWGAMVMFMLAIALFGNSLYMTAKAEVAQILIANAWQDAQATGTPKAAKPWHWADTYPVSRIQMAAQDVDLVVLQSASGEALSFGPGWLAESSLPGSLGDSIVAGHRDTHFNFLQYLSKGDLLTVETLSGQKVAYQISEMEIVDSQTNDLDIDPSRQRLRLVTCYPFDSLVEGSLRYVVTAEVVNS